MFYMNFKKVFLKKFKVIVMVLLKSNIVKEVGSLLC